MLISHSHKFIFIHVYKSGGTSVKEALAPFSEEAPGLMPHATALEARAALPKHFNDYFKFAFVRNPWDFEVSLYHFHLRRFREQLPGNQWTREISFEEFVLARAYKRNARGTQCKFITDLTGGILLDFVGRMESLERDFGFVCRTLGLKTELGHLNRTQHRPYQSYYNPLTREILRHLSQPEIRMFGYTFEEAAEERSEAPIAAKSLRAVSA